MKNKGVFAMKKGDALGKQRTKRGKKARMMVWDGEDGGERMRGLIVDGWVDVKKAEGVERT